MPLGNKVAVVTGAAQGLGLAIARRLAQDGASVLLCDLQEEKVRRVAAALMRDGLQAESAPLDVTDAPAVTAVFEETFRHRGRLDILVNSAGLGQKVTPTVELADEEWHRILEVNLTGTFYCCRAAGRLMRRRESGSMVNLASINAHSPAALVAAYNAAKAGVASLTRTLAIELAAYGVRVNAVSPGPVYTDFKPQDHGPAKPDAGGSAGTRWSSGSAGPYRWGAGESPRTSPPWSPSCAGPKRPGSPGRCSR